MTRGVSGRREDARGARVAAKRRDDFVHYFQCDKLLY